MEAVNPGGLRRPIGVALREPGYAPALPTLWPHMLLARARTPQAFPFDAPHLRLYYFARNAVWTAARVLGLDKGELLMPAYHHGVEVEALLAAGVRLRFYRVDERMRVDLADIERQIGPHTRGVYLIHYNGFPGPARELRALCDARGLKLVEDCALALLSADGPEPLGRLGDAAVFCLYKTLPVPHGGLLVLNGQQPAGIPEPPAPPALATARLLTASLLMNLELRGGEVGRVVRELVTRAGRAAMPADKTDHVPTGTQHFELENAGLGMSPLNWRLTLSQDFAHIVEARRRNYFLMLRRTRELVHPLWPSLPAGCCPLFFPLKLRHPDRVARRLTARRVETVDFWRGGHPACDLSAYPEVRELRRSVLEIPIHQDLEPDACDALADAVVAAVKEAGA